LAVFVADDDLAYVAVNRYACDLLGYTREELLALRVFEVATYPEAEDEFREMIAAGRRTGTAELTRKDGSAVEVHYRASTTTVAGMTLYVAVCWT
jgi:PAS domain S-box-containing protein